MRMKAQPAVPLEYTKRHGFMTAQYAVRDIYDALVELVTNCDDSYRHMNEDRGQIRIEVEHRRKGRGSRVVVKDRAQGMSLHEMQTRIRKVGDLTSVEGDRGFMARGAKDCAVLGDVTFQSVKDGRYSKCVVRHTMDFVPYGPSVRATRPIREQLGIPRGNGTVVTIETHPNIRVQRHSTLLCELPHLYALRDIMRKGSTRKVLLVDLNRNEPPDRLIYEDPAGEVLVSERFEVPGYPGAIAYLQILKAHDRIQNPPDKRLRRTGLLVKGERAIHEATFLSGEFENDPYAEFYFGRLTCERIDALCKEYDGRREKGIPQTESNPVLLIDPNRQSGLNRSHPFTKALFQIPAERLRVLIAKDKEKERQKRVQIENDQTRERLKKLAKAASKFIREKIEELEEFTFENGAIENKEFVRKGVLIIPDRYRLAIGETKAFGFRARRQPGVSEGEGAKVRCDTDCIRIITPELVLTPSKTAETVMTGVFRVQGIKEADAVPLSVSYDGLPTADALISVVSHKTEEIDIPNGLAFERERYQVREGRKKRLLLRAVYPSVVAEEVSVQSRSNCQHIVVLRPQTHLKPVAGTNYAEGYVVIQGRKLGSRGTIAAEVHGHVAQTGVKVIQAREAIGLPIKIEVRDEEYGSFRARWDRPNNSNLLLISARHPSVRRYLGPAPTFEGQNSVHFKLLLAEIVSENVCRKILETLQRQTPFEFEGLDVDSFYAHHNRLMKEFTPIAHEVQLSRQELRAL